MSTLQVAQLFFWSLVFLAAYNAFWAIVTTVSLRRRRVLAADDQLPKAAVFLCLRGADPSLETCLRRLMVQDYPDYEILIAVDSRHDPAWDVVQETIRDSSADNVRVSILRHRLKTCSLKCSCLVQLLDEIDDSHEMILLADADLISHRTWMRELVAPLADRRVGAAFGNRWFLPPGTRMGSLIRQLWNIPGVVVMNALQIPWAGSLAIRTSLVKSAKLRHLWSHSIVDDGPVRAAVKAQGMRLRFVPSLVMANREECDVAFAYNFLRRQLTWTRTYVIGWWPAMMVYNLLMVAIYGGAVALACVCFSRGETDAGILLGSGVMILTTVLIMLAVILDAAARRVIREQGEPAPANSFAQWVRMPLVILIAIPLNLLAALAASFFRRIVWRGVAYEIRGPWDVRMLEDVVRPSSDTADVSI